MTERDEIKKQPPKTYSRREILKALAKGTIIGLPLGIGITQALERLSGTTDERAQRTARKYFENGGTPTPSPEWRRSEEILKNSTVKIGYLSEWLDSEQFNWTPLGSAGIIEGGVIERPDIVLVSSARHVVLNENAEPELTQKPLILENKLKGDFCLVLAGRYTIAESREYDFSLIAFKATDAIAYPEFFKGIITRINDKLQGTDQVVVGGYNLYFKEGIGQDLPAISYLDSQNLSTKDKTFIYKGEGQAHGSSGGPALDKEGMLVGVLTGSIAKLFSPTQIAITPIYDFGKLSDEAIKALG